MEKKKKAVTSQSQDSVHNGTFKKIMNIVPESVVYFFHYDSPDCFFPQTSHTIKSAKDVYRQRKKKRKIITLFLAVYAGRLFPI